MNNPWWIGGVILFCVIYFSLWHHAWKVGHGYRRTDDIPGFPDPLRVARIRGSEVVEEQMKRPPTTQPDWPEYQYPTPTELRDWFLRQSPEYQAWFMAKDIQMSDEANACFLQNHQRDAWEKTGSVSLWSSRRWWFSHRSRRSNELQGIRSLRLIDHMQRFIPASLRRSYRSPHWPFDR